MPVNLGQPEGYYRGYENGKQESAARIRELEDRNVALREALGAAYKEVKTAQATLKKVMLSGDIPTTPNTYTLVNADMDLRAARVLIKDALKKE